MKNRKLNACYSAFRVLRSVAFGRLAGSAGEGGRRRVSLALFLTLAFSGICAEVEGVEHENMREQLAAHAPQILFIKRRPVAPSFYAYTEGQSDGQRERHFLPGSALCVLDVKTGEVETLLEDKAGVIRDVDVSFDGAKILFAWKKGPSIDDDDFHLFEMDAQTRKIRQLTFGKGVADYEPCYLPNGDIVFVSSRCVQTVDCWKTEVSNLYTCDKDGKYLRRLGFDQVHTTHPSVLNDGRIAYTRWDYNDRGQLYPQPLFQMSPDGTGQTEYYGNNSWFPTVISHARAIPGSNKLIAVLHGHHTWQAGKLAWIDRSKGTQENEGVQLIAPIRETKAVRVDRYGQDETLFRHPYPLSETEFLVGMTTNSNARKDKTPFELCYINADGESIVLASDPMLSCGEPIPLQARKRPPVVPSRVDYAQTNGTYFVQDVYEGPGLKGVARGSIEKLRVVAIDFRAAPVGNTRSRGEAGGSYNSTPVSVGNATWDPKTILGEATVHADGSAMFYAPANTPLYFQCIDTNGQVAATMRSWSTLMPGERFGCVGCHEDKMNTPPPTKTTLAMRQEPQVLQPFYELTDRGFSFMKHVQPILDQHCIRCHNPEEEKRMDLTANPSTKGTAQRRWFNSYLNLVEATPDKSTMGNPDGKWVKWISSQSRPTMLPPYFAGSATSPLIKELRKNHGKTQLSKQELDTLCAWIDLGVPFCGDYLEANVWHPGDFDRYIRYQRKREKLAQEVQDNVEKFYFAQTGKELSLPPVNPRYTDYVKDRAKNARRNIALEATASSNSECRNKEFFKAKNVINGQRENFKHGPNYPSWGPEQIPNPWLKLEWKQEKEVSEVVVYIRADFPHDGYWKSGTLVFSDGKEIPFTLKKTGEPQSIKFPATKTSSITFEDLVWNKPNTWCAWTEVEVY